MKSLRALGKENESPWESVCMRELPFPLGIKGELDLPISVVVSGVGVFLFV